MRLKIVLLFGNFLLDMQHMLTNFISLFFNLLIICIFYFCSFSPLVAGKTDLYIFEKEKTVIKNFKNLKNLYEQGSNGVGLFSRLSRFILIDIFQQSIVTRHNEALLYRLKNKNNLEILIYKPEKTVQCFDDKNKNEIEHSLDYLNKRLQYLEDKGAKKIIILPIPTKFSIFTKNNPPYLNSFLAFINKISYSAGDCSSKEAKNLYQYFIKNINPKLSTTVDLFKTYENLYDSWDSQDLDTATFVIEDTHWSNYGSTIAAREILKNTYNLNNENFTMNKIPKKGWAKKQKEGDLQVRLNIPNWQKYRVASYDYPAFDLQMKNNYIEQQFDRVIFFGTSYSKTMGESYREQIKLNIKAKEYLDYTTDGGAIITSLENLLINKQEDKIKNSLIIWEFPFRYATTPKQFKFKNKEFQNLN